MPAGLKRVFHSWIARISILEVAMPKPKGWNMSLVYPLSTLVGRLVFVSVQKCGYFGACCLDVRTLTFCQLMGFSIKPLKVNLLAGEQKATEVI